MADGWIECGKGTGRAALKWGRITFYELFHTCCLAAGVCLIHIGRAQRP